MTTGQPRIYGKSLAAKGRRQPAAKPTQGPPCKRCGKPRPPVAVAHDDPWCSSICMKVATGLMTEAEGDALHRRHRNTSGERAYSSQTGPYEGTG